ncbi:hypothetical protein PHAVU_008G149506 [Phaseolus vulgaris]
MTDDELFSSCNENETEGEEFNDILTEEERRQLEDALRLDSLDLANESDEVVIGHRHSCYEHRDIPIEDGTCNKSGENKQEKKGWFGGWRKKDLKPEAPKKIAAPRSSLCVEEKVSDLLGDSPSRNQTKPGRHSVEIAVKGDESRRKKDAKASSANSDGRSRHKDGNRENEYKKGLRPILWLSPNFPLKLKNSCHCSTLLQTKLKQFDD